MGTRPEIGVGQQAGTLAAQGLHILRQAVRTELLGWQAASPRSGSSTRAKENGDGAAQAQA